MAEGEAIPIDEVVAQVLAKPSPASEWFRPDGRARWASGPERLARVVLWVRLA